MKVVVSGSSGLIGMAFGGRLASTGDEMIRLVRRPAKAPGEFQWNPHAAGGGIDPAALEGADAVVHLAGAPIAAGRWTAARKREIRDSRIAGTSALVSALTAMEHPPPVLLSGSAIGYYGDTGGREVDESSAAGTGFLADVVRDWEQAADPARAAGIRTAHLRSGIVLDPGGGTLGKLLPLFRLGLGIPLGSGAQYMSWITLADEVGAIRFLLGREDMRGPVNGTAPHPVTNAEFTDALNAALGRPTLLRLPVPGLRLPGSVLHVPTVALRVALGEVTGELLASARVVPRRLQQAGYEFRHPELGPALRAMLT